MSSHFGSNNTNHWTTAIKGPTQFKHLPNCSNRNSWQSQALEMMHLKKQTHCTAARTGLKSLGQNPSQVETFWAKANSKQVFLGTSPSQLKSSTTFNLNGATLCVTLAWFNHLEIFYGLIRFSQSCQQTNTLFTIWYVLFMSASAFNLTEHIGYYWPKHSF